MRFRVVSKLILFLIVLASCARQQERRLQSGDFDYYLLNLSWSPEFCYSHPGKPECSRSYGFVAHGLWPQVRNGRGPEYCSQAPGPSDLASILDIMPDPSLIHHEWLAHGTCTGMTADSYFTLLKQAVDSVHIPHSFRNLRTELRATPYEIVRSFIQANPGLPATAVQITCRGAYLQSVSICLSRNLRPITCPIRRECREHLIKIAPIR